MSEQIFTWEGISLPSYWGGNWGSATADVAFEQIKNTGASSVAIIPNFYMQNKYSNTMGLVANQSETIEQTRAAMLDVTSRGMNVMLKPHVESLDWTWRAEIAPTDVTLWFQNYKTMMLQYAVLAQETGAPMICVGTEMKSLSGAAYRDKWVDLIASIRGVYDGLVTYAATYDEAPDVSFWDQVDYIGVDAYVPLTYSNTPTVDEMVRAWTETPTNDYVRQIYGGKSVVEYYKALSEQYGKKMIFTEVGYRSLDGANKDPGTWANGGTVDQQEQRDAYEALFKVMTTWGGQWLDGAFLWSYHPFENPESAGVQTTDYTTQGKLANATVTAGYSSPAHVTGLTRTGTTAVDKLDGGYHNDVLSGGGGNDILWGGAGEDKLNGGDGDDRLTGGRGTDTIDGGAGVDTAVFSGAKADYTILRNGDGSTTITDTRADKDGTDIVMNVQFAKFSDQTVDLDATTTPPPNDPPPTDPPPPAEEVIIWGTSSADTLRGGDVNETIYGLAGNDKLYGAGGNDILVGGYGPDTMTGGAGFDTFVLDGKTSGKKVDRIVDFNSAEDKILIDSAALMKLSNAREGSTVKLKKGFFTIGKNAKDKNDYLVYDPTKKVLFFDADGSGHGAKMAVMTFFHKEKLVATDLFLI